MDKKETDPYLSKKTFWTVMPLLITCLCTLIGATFFINYNRDVILSAQYDSYRTEMMDRIIAIHNRINDVNVKFERILGITSSINEKLDK